MAANLCDAVTKLRADRVDLAWVKASGTLGWPCVASQKPSELPEAARETRGAACRLKIMHAPYAISSFTVSTAYRTVFDQNQPPLASKASFTDPAFGTTSDVCRLCTRRVGP